MELELAQAEEDKARLAKQKKEQEEQNYNSGQYLLKHTSIDAYKVEFCISLMPIQQSINQYLAFYLLYGNFIPKKLIILKIPPFYPDIPFSLKKTLNFSQKHKISLNTSALCHALMKRASPTYQGWYGNGLHGCI